MARSKNGSSGKRIAASALTQRDVNRLKRQGAEYVKVATTTKQKARNTLVGAGIFTKSGQFSKRVK